MKRDSEGFKNFVDIIRKYCKRNYTMNLDGRGELVRLQKLMEEKGEKLSLSTLQRIFLGTNKSQERMNDSTLNILAEFIGYKDVDDCIYKNNEHKANSQNIC